MQDNHDAALYYLQQLLDKKPCHYTALVQLLGLLRRAGKLSEADKYIKAAESRATGGPQGSTDSSVTNLGGGVKLGGAADGGGLSYCKGVLQRCGLAVITHAVRTTPAGGFRVRQVCKM